MLQALFQVGIMYGVCIGFPNLDIQGGVYRSTGAPNWTNILSQSYNTTLFLTFSVIISLSKRMH